jgi:hypothetical protein
MPAPFIGLAAFDAWSWNIWFIAAAAPRRPVPLQTGLDILSNEIY